MPSSGTTASHLPWSPSALTFRSPTTPGLLCLKDVLKGMVELLGKVKMDKFFVIRADYNRTLAGIHWLNSVAAHLQPGMHNPPQHQTPFGLAMGTWPLQRRNPA